MVDVSLPAMVRKPVVIAGSACSGKSTVLDLLSRHPHLADRILIMPEVFTRLFASGVIKPASDLEGILRNQEIVVREQLKAEYASAEAAKAQNRTLVCDRALPDAAVYVPGGVARFEQMVGRSMSAVLERYGLIIQLGLPPEDVFEAARASNPARVRSYREVIKDTQTLSDIYSRHPNRVVVPYHPDFRRKAEQVFAAIESYLD